MKYMTHSVVWLAIIAVLPARAATQIVLVPPSTVTITATQMGVPMDATFTKFNASISFDPVHLAASRAQFIIDIASFDLGDAEYNGEVLKSVWLDAVRYPTATFTSTSMKILSPTQIEVAGKITIKGRTQAVRFPVTVKDSGKTRSYDGVVRIKRTDFQIGTGEWKAVNLVADEVIIKVHAVAVTKN